MNILDLATGIPFRWGKEGRGAGRGYVVMVGGGVERGGLEDAKEYDNLCFFKYERLLADPN